MQQGGMARTLKERLRDGEQLYGAFSVSFSPVVAEILGWAGYDYVVVDMEHGPGDTMAAVPMLQALASTGTPAILRLPVNDPVWAKKALDLGPAGIMFPMINDAAAARDAVRSCRYPPAGVRGAAFPIVRAARYGLDPDYLSRCEDDLLIMCQVHLTGYSSPEVDRDRRGANREPLAASTRLWRTGHDRGVFYLTELVF